MKIFRELSIKYKLIVVVLLTASIGLTLAGGASLSYDHIMQKQALAEEMQILSRVVALRSAAALSFSDQKNALANLNTLKVSSSVRFACMYDAEGRIFVKVGQVEVHYECPTLLKADGEYFEQDYLDVFQSVVRNNEVIGRVFIRSGLEKLDDRLLKQLIVSVAVLIISLCLAFAFTARMLRQIYRPIIQLGKIAVQVSNNNNYAIRASVENNDELGRTVKAFNDMLHEIEQDKKELVQLAYYDPLTGLPNRRMFSERIKIALMDAARYRDSKIALIFMDVDKFKQINDTLGHDIGDIFLIEFSKRLQAALPNTATAFRLGGDEFTVIQKDVLDKVDIIKTAQAIYKEISPDLQVAGQTLTMSVSLGIVISDGKDTPITIMKNADIALYRAKDAGRGNYQFFS